MANKPEFVDMISEATRQNRRHFAPRTIIEPEVKERSRLSHPTQRWVEWRMETFTPWKLKPWKTDR